MKNTGNGKIRKIIVTKGIYWVEVPDAGLSILCGCPADSVKHLMQRGLIVTIEKDGVSFETGPNAILLSDIMIQSGFFSNLAEFPVLQMLYRQGMILPNHPGNTGIKPLLIGSKKQIDAQMEYIYRGNYGLISKEELMTAGASSELADNIMRMKLNFAFGKIRNTEELLDSVIVDSGAGETEIRNGVYIRREGLNIFEIKYQNESVMVDLNINQNENIRSPYPLGFQDIKREYFAIIHSGQGDGWDINRPCMSSILMFQGKVYLIDAGPNLAYCLIALGIGINEIEGIFQTHSHDDHFAGLTTLLRTDHRIKYYATPLVRATVFKKLAALLSVDENSFSDFFEIKNLQSDVWNSIEGLEVKPFLSPHPVETTIFTFRTFWDADYLTYAHLADIVSIDDLKGMVEESDSETGISQEFYERVREEYLTPVNLKKIDIGGGLIHGRAEDFRSDRTERIILAHTAVPLTAQQKEIGSSAPFGIVDVLIPDYSDLTRQIASDFLESYFPSVPSHHLKILLNNQVVNFKSGSIIIKEGTINKNIYLLLTGNIEMLQSKYGIYNMLSSGEMIGEHSGLNNCPSIITYRAVSYAYAMLIPNTMYLDFVKQNKLYAKIKRLHENREFLQRTWLFGESISYPTQNGIAEKMKLHHFDHSDETFADINSSSIYIVKSGSLKRGDCDDNEPAVNTGDFFGAEPKGYLPGSAFSFRTLEPSTVYEIPCDVFKGIPIILWKLLETYGKKMIN